MLQYSTLSVLPSQISVLWCHMVSYGVIWCQLVSDNASQCQIVSDDSCVLPSQISVPCPIGTYQGGDYRILPMSSP